jgi:hypothetical protein
MERPHLINPTNSSKKWNLFEKIRAPVKFPTVNDLGKSLIHNTKKITPPAIVTVPMSKKELIKHNSIFLNVSGIIIIVILSYCLYAFYLEKKIFTQFSKNQEDSSNSGPKPTSGILSSKKNSLSS